MSKVLPELSQIAGEDADSAVVHQLMDLCNPSSPVEFVVASAGTLFKLSGGICHMAHLLTCTGSTLPGMKARSQHRSLVLGPPGPGLCASLRKKVQTVRENPLPGVHFGECTRSGVMSYAHEQSLTMQNARHAMSCKPFCIASTHPHKKS